MGKQDPRVDAYITRSADFAKPILIRVRKLIHQGCPDVEETIKWNFPAFMHHGILCGLAAFKQHCTFGFWHTDMRKVLGDDAKSGNAMGQLGRITSLEDLPDEATLLSWIKQATKLNESGMKSPAANRPRVAKKLPVPKDLQNALKKSKKAAQAFDGFSPSHRNEYIEWITEAKRPETRAARLKTAVEWLVQGKSRNWKYERQPKNAAKSA